MKNKLKLRESNFELLRIVSMIFIILYHLVFHSGYEINNVFNLKKLVFTLFMSGGKLGVILFVMITGYYKIKSKDVKWNKLIGLELQVLFYSIFFIFVFGVIGGKSFLIGDLSRMLLPNISKTYWFFSSYFILCLLMPYLNKLVDVISKKDFERLLIIGFVFLILIPSVVIYNKEISWGIYLFYYYLVGGYIRLYGNNLVGCKRYLLGFSLSYIFIVFITMFIGYLSKSNEVLLDSIYTFSEISSVLLFVGAICMFLFFKNLNIKHNNVINRLASVSFGVYLFHENYFMRGFLWLDTFRWDNLFGSGLIAGILIAVLIYLSGGLIEILREVIFKYFNSLIRKEKASR